MTKVKEKNCFEKDKKLKTNGGANTSLKFVKNIKDEN